MKDEFERVAIPHIRTLYNFAYKNTQNHADAGDLLQDTYIRAFRFFDKYNEGTNCRAWLFKIMKNLFVNNYRKNNKSPLLVNYCDIENYFDSIKSVHLDTTDLQERVYSNLLDDDITDALNSLQDDFKTVIILCDLEGLSYEEISEFVQCPVGTVRSRIHRARRLLGKKLSGYAKSKGYRVEQTLMTA